MIRFISSIISRVWGGAFTDRSVGLGTSAPSSLMRSLMLNLLLLSTETQTTHFQGENKLSRFIVENGNVFKWEIKSEESDSASGRKTHENFRVAPHVRNTRRPELKHLQTVVDGLCRCRLCFHAPDQVTVMICGLRSGDAWGAHTVTPPACRFT